MKIEQIPSELKEARKFYEYILRHRDWMTSKLRSAYVHIGDEQREFIENLDPLALHINTYRDMAGYLEVADSTSFRLLRGRYSEIVPLTGQPRITPLKILMPNKDELARIHSASKINQILDEERISNQGYSDQIISQLTNGLVARRTVTKYRLESGLPKYQDRKNAYTKNPNTKFEIPLYS